MKKNTVIIAAVAAVFVFLLLAIGTLSFTLISNNQKTAAAEQEEQINQKVEERIQEKEQEEADEKKAAEKKQADEKAAKNKANYITAKEAYDTYTERGVAVRPIECEITAKEKKIPSNVDQKAEGGMLTCEGLEYRVYVGNDRKYNLMSVGDRYGFQVRWIESNLYYFYVDVIGGTF